MSFNKYIPYYITNLRLALPVVLTQLGGGLVGMFDTIMVGHVDAYSLAAVSFANSIFVIGFVAAMGVPMAITPMVGQSDARGETDEVASILGNGLCFTLFFGTLISILLFAIVPLMPLMGQEAEVIKLAKPYYCLQVISILPAMVFFCGKQFLEGLGNTKVAMWIMLFTNTLNIILNYILIFGHFGAPALGATGAGIASLAARTLSPLIIFVCIRKTKQWNMYLKMIQWSKINWSSIKEVAVVGLPIGGQSVLECLSFSISCIMVGWLGAVSLASHEIACQLSNITWMGIMGVGSATVIRVSHLYGVKDYENMRYCATASIHLAIIYELFTSLIIIGFCKQIPMIFTNDAAVIAMAPALIICCGLYQISDGLQVIGLSILRGMTDVKRPVVYSFLGYLVICIPIGYLLLTRTGLGAIGVWIGFITTLTTMAVLFLLRYKRLLKELK